MQAHAAVPSRPEIYLRLRVVHIAVNAHHKCCCQGHGNAAGKHKNGVEVYDVVRVARFHLNSLCSRSRTQSYPACAIGLSNIFGYLVKWMDHYRGDVAPKVEV